MDDNLKNECVCVCHKYSRILRKTTYCLTCTCEKKPPFSFDKEAVGKIKEVING